jgi:hypothetical protein
MAYTHIEKSSGQLILSAEWNNMGRETVRLENDKVNRSGDTIKGDLTVTGKFSASLDSKFDNGLSVGNLSVGTNLNVGGTLRALGDLNVKGELTVTGKFTGSVGNFGSLSIDRVDVASQLTVGKVSISNDILNVGDVKVAGQFSASGNGRFDTLLSVGKDLSVGGALSLTGKFTGSGDGKFENGLSIGANLSVSGRINVQKGVIQKGGDTIIGTEDLGLYSPDEGYWIRLVTKNSPIRFFTDGGAGTTAELSVEKGAVNLVTSSLNFGEKTRQMINLWKTSYAIGVQGSTHYSRSDKNFVWYKGGTHVDGELDPGGGTAQMILRGDGNLGVGTSNLNARLSVVAAGAYEVTGTAMSPTMRISSGTLGTAINSELALATIGFNSGNQSGLGIRAIRYKLGTDWNSTAIGLGMDVDNTVRAGASLLLQADGGVKIIGNLGTHGYSPTPKTSGWGGGIHTWDIEAEGTIWSNGAYQTGARDLAENYQSDTDLEPGDVVCLDTDQDKIAVSEKSNDPLIFGVISTQPGFLLNTQRDPGEIKLFPVALCGRVPCKVVDENGPIKRGDLLTSSSIPGHAMKSSPINMGDENLFRPGTIIGKALSGLESGKGIIEIFVFSS